MDADRRLCAAERVAPLALTAYVFLGLIESQYLLMHPVIGFFLNIAHRGAAWVIGGGLLAAARDAVVYEHHYDLRRKRQIVIYPEERFHLDA